MTLFKYVNRSLRLGNFQYAHDMFDTTPQPGKLNPYLSKGMLFDMGHVSNNCLAISFIDMFSKCGYVEKERLVFDGIEYKVVVSCT